MSARATSFNTWISENALRLKQTLSVASPLDEDAYQDAYLSLAKESRRQDKDATFEKAFVGAYRKFSRKALNETYTTSHPDDLFFTLLSTPQETEATEPETTRTKEKLAKAIKTYIQATYSRAEVAVWEMRMVGISIRDIADALGISRAATDSTLRRITEQTRTQFAYAL